MTTKEKYRSAIESNIHETLYAISEINAVNKLAEKYPNSYRFNFFYYASNALYKDSISRAIKILEKNYDNNTLSFWYIYNQNRTFINNILTENNMNIDELEVLSKKLKHLRNKLFFHLDKKGVKDSNSIWKEADITGDFLESTLHKLRTVFEKLYKIEFRKEYHSFVYDAEDITAIIEACKKDGFFVTN